MSVSKRQHLRLINERSRRVRSTKGPRVRTGKQARGDRNVGVDGEMNVEHLVTAPTPDAEVSHGQKNIAVTPQAERSVGEGEVTMALVKDEQIPSATGDRPDVGNEGSTETECRTKKGRPKGSRNVKHNPGIRKRSERIKEKFPRYSEEVPPAEPPKEVMKVLPQWWKDAVLAAMLAKKAIAEGQEENIEVRIDEDEEFLDKGNYSDDEWYQQLCAEELGKAETGHQKEIGKPDVTLAFQDEAAEDKVLLQ